MLPVLYGPDRDQRLQACLDWNVRISARTEGIRHENFAGATLQ